MTMTEDVKQALMIIMVHVQTMPTVTREGLVADLKRVLSGTPISELLNTDEALLMLTQNKQECVTGVMTTQQSGGIK